MYTLGEAARAAGKTRPAIAKAIKTGRISASRGEDGSYQIDPAELHRVYPVVTQPYGLGLQKFPPVGSPETAAGLREELTKWRALADERDETIRDLRTRLDASEAERRHESEERRRAQERLTALLAAPAKPVEPEPPSPRRRRFLTWLKRQHGL